MSARESDRHLGFGAFIDEGNTNKEMYQRPASAVHVMRKSPARARMPLRVLVREFDSVFQEVSKRYLCIMCSRGFGRHAMGHIELLSRRCN